MPSLIKKTGLLFCWLLLMSTTYAYAVPPYLGISVGDELSFTKTVCLQSAQAVLKQQGFQKIVQYKRSATLFAAAYQQPTRYQYKAVVKCLPREGVIVVVVVAESSRHLQRKAAHLRWKIQQFVQTQPKNMAKPIQYASVPPFLGISVGRGNALKSQACFLLAQRVLKQEGFQKILSYERSTSLFAAYRNRLPYHYKALVKCLPKQGLIVVVIVKEATQNIKQKAYSLRRQIQQRAERIYRVKKEIEQKVQDLPENNQNSPKDKIIKPNSNEEEQTLTSEASQHTILTQLACLSRAEKSIRRSGFYKAVEIDEHAVQALHPQRYIGVIRCIAEEEFVFFWVKGPQTQVRKSLLSRLQRYF